MSTSHGSFVWYELMTSDAKAAEGFYRNVLGWNMQDSGMPGFAYTILQAGTTPIGGLMTLPPDAAAMGARVGWIGYIAVDDVDGYATRVKQAGGAIHRPADDIPGVGRFAVAADPHGAPFVLFKSSHGEQPEQPAPNTPGHPGWRELFAGNLDSAFAFYSDLFGWTKAEAFDMGPMGIYQLFAINGVPSGGMMTKAPDMPVPFWRYYFNIDGAEAAAARVKENGGQVLMGPHQVPGDSWIIQCLDPQGGMFGLVSLHR